jgi:hypothetical protein
MHNFLGAVLLVTSSHGSGHGYIKMCLVHYYPDAFYIFNKMASWGSYVSGFSIIIFIWILIDAFITKNNRFIF